MKLDRNFPILSLRLKSELVDFAVNLFRQEDPDGKSGINWNKLPRYIQAVSQKYFDNHYHNLHHAIDTTNVLAWMLALPVVRKGFPPLHRIMLMTAALVHDVEHPGKDNNWEINIRSNLATKYDNRAVLENHSAQVALGLLADPELNFLDTLPGFVQDDSRKMLHDAVLATDFARHRDFITILEAKLSGSHDFSDPEFLSLVEFSLLKAADISNPGKVFEQAKKWAECVVKEFWAQGKEEKKRNLPVGMLNDQEKVELHAAQAGFIKMQVMDLFVLLSRLDPGFQEVVDALEHNLGKYNKAAEAIRQRREHTKKVAVNQTATSAP
ncbi:MAG: 3',5'-cyclic nucleotide phosphodiesterase [Deltaproteobacteria bacterium]|nr:3',5'-cyclic nucleotide phosphodiesterase [Deltaproteobacteria bacterium]